MLVNLSKIIASKIYISSTLQCDMQDSTNKFFATVFDTSSSDGFAALLKVLKFVPKTKEYVYYPANVINPASLAPVPAIKDRSQFYQWAKDHVEGSVTPLMNLELSESQKTDHSPIVINLNAYFKGLDPYADENKTSATNKYKYYKLALSKILPKYVASANGHLNLLIDVKGGVAQTSMLFFLIYGMRHDFEGISEMLKGIRLVLIDSTHGLFFSPDMTDKKKVNTFLNMTAKFVQMAAKFDSKEILKDKDVTIADDSVVVSATVDQKILDDITNNFDIDKTQEVSNKEAEKILDAAAIKHAAAEKDPTSVDSVTVANETDLSEVLATDATNEFVRIRAENEKFLQRYKPMQDKALAAVEKDAIDAYTNPDLEVRSVRDDSVMNPSMKRSVIGAITGNYYKKLHKRDVLNCFKSLNNDPDHPVVITGYSRKDSSDPLNLKEELSVQMIDKNGKRHTFTVDVPKISHDGFLYINGNKKYISKQAALLPIIKEAIDRVQITTNYKKTFLYRKNDKTSGTVDRLLKTFVGKKVKGVKQVFGNSFASNLSFGVSIPYNVFAKRLFALEITEGSTGGSVMHVVFNQKKIRADIVAKGGSIDPQLQAIPVAYRALNGKVDTIFFEHTTRSGRTVVAHDKNGIAKKGVPTFTGIADFLQTVIRNSGNTELQNAFADSNAGKALGHSQIRLAGQTIALGVLISFYKGLRDTLDMYKVKYTVSDKATRPAPNETMLRFKDATIYIDCEGDTTKELLVNGFYYLNTKEYELKDSEMRGAMYLEYFGEYCGSRNTAKALLNFESSMIDPITLDVLKDLNLPTTFVELLLLGNSMLGDYSHKRKNDMSNFRIRDSEVVSVAVYDAMIAAFNEYKRTVKTGMVTSISAPKDVVMKRLMTYQCVEDYSILSPFLEIQSKAKTTFKGPSGLNSDDAYTAEIRSYDDSMVGVFGVFTPVSGSVGINRSMSLNPRIGHIRGYLTKTSMDDMGMDNLYAPGELLNIFAASHSDPMRICMSVTQGGHIMPTMKQHNYLIGTGIDKTLAHLTGQDFAFKASDSGTVTKIDTANQLVFLKYANGETTAIDISDKPAKNSSNGFYTKNRLELVDNIKVGSRFKAGDILATNKQFFKQDMDGSHGFAAGRLTKVALMCLATTYEDSMPITDRVRRECASDVISEKQCILKENSKLIKIAKEGQTININEPLMVFEEIGDSEKDALNAVERASVNEIGGDMEYFGKNVVKSKYAGVITNVKVYYNCDLESPNLEPSLKEYLQSYITKHQRRSNTLKGIKDDELIEQASTERIMKDKILGNEMQGVLIVFYIMHQEDASIGNKLTFFSACKGIVSEVIPDDKAPYTDYRPDDTIEAMISPMSLIARNVPDLMLTGLANRVIVELKKQVLEDLGLA